MKKLNFVLYLIAAIMAAYFGYTRPIAGIIVALISIILVQAYSNVKSGLDIKAELKKTNSKLRRAEEEVYRIRNQHNKIVTKMVTALDVEPEPAKRGWLRRVVGR